jgi:hypothetical protein
MDATAKGAETTHVLEVERECNEIRSQMRLQMMQGRRTNWRRKGSCVGVRSQMRLQREQG